MHEYVDRTAIQHLGQSGGNVSPAGRSSGDVVGRQQKIAERVAGERARRKLDRFAILRWRRLNHRILPALSIHEVIQLKIVHDDSRLPTPAGINALDFMKAP